MVTFTINIPHMLAYIPYMDPMGNVGKYSIHGDMEHLGTTVIGVKPSVLSLTNSQNGGPGAYDPKNNAVLMGIPRRAKRRFWKNPRMTRDGIRRSFGGFHSDGIFPAVKGLITTTRTY